MTETQKRIEAYKKALPEIRERVIAVALLFAMSMAMMTSATFAWLTISRAPEVTAVNTTVAANGNLEIALATGDGTTAPGESKVGDSSAAKGQSVTAANITWGNLVNLSDPSYGLDNLTLRPAQLNKSALLTSPLRGAVYDGDGRINKLNTEFGYASWVMPDGNIPGYFKVSENYGVRAISSMTFKKMDQDSAIIALREKFNSVLEKNENVASKYSSLGANTKYMQSLATMMGLYMTARMNPDEASLNNPTIAIADIQNLRDMYGAFLECFDMEAEALAALANLSIELQGSNVEAYTAEKILSSTETSLEKDGILIGDTSKSNGFNQFIRDRNIIASDYAKLVEICESGQSLTWKDTGINNIVNNLVDVGKCTIGADNTPISSIGASNAMGYLSGTQEARITNGILYRFEERTGGYIEVKNLSISAKVKRMGITIPATVKANIQTTASRDYKIFENDLKYIQENYVDEDSLGTPDYVAEDTYGLAVDLWVRTNAENSYLTLEGNILTVTTEETVIGKDKDGNDVLLYTLTRSVEVENEDGTTSTVPVDMDVYKIETQNEDGTTTTTWYDATNHLPISAEEMGDSEPKQKIIEVETVTGFEGENRVWDNAMISAEATTQGSGSCYVYYADTPEDQARSLKLLEAFNVAFVDDEGKFMASAVMDTEHFYAESGRVIVPLVLDTSNSINLGEDYEGSITYAITPLQKNVPTRVTAIVYLDGNKLTNKDVLAASEIQGKLNIQFGSSESMNPIENEDLANKELIVSATVDPATHEYDGSKMKSTVTVNVSGYEPTNVKAFFLREITSTQGSREAEMTFTNQSGAWIAEHNFTAPGNYVLRTVQLDGVDYDLSVPPRVTIAGFDVQSLSCEEATNNHVRIFTANSSATINLNLQFATDNTNKMPTTVQGRFLREDGNAVNVDFTKGSNDIWSGKATFFSSGEYTLQYLVLDGEYYPVDEDLWQTADITLGIRVEVYTTSPHLIVDDGGELEENESLFKMQVNIMDDTGEKILGLGNVKLVYGMKGSILRTIDGNLTWDGSYYSGELTNPRQSAIWQFSKVTIGENSTITTAITAPTFTVRSVTPSEYKGNSTHSYQYTASNEAYMDVMISNTAMVGLKDGETIEDSVVWARIVNTKEEVGTDMWVPGLIGNTDETTGYTHWKFTIPVNEDGYQDGNWEMTELKLWDVYNEKGILCTEDSPMIIDVSEKGITSKVVARTFVTFDEGQDENFEGLFMQKHDLTGFSVNIKDFEDQAIKDADENEVISDVQLQFKLETSTISEYGHYTGSVNNTTPGAVITIPLNTAENGKYSQAEDTTAEAIFAGEYSTALRFKMGGATVTYGQWEETGTPVQGTQAQFAEDAYVPHITVSSEKPTVTISSVSTNVSTDRYYLTSTPSSLNVISGSYNKKIDAYNAVVYMYVSAQSGSLDQEQVQIKYPTVTLSLSGIPTTHSGVTMVFPSGNNTSSTFTFAEGGTTASSTIGAGTSGTFNEGILGFGSGVTTWPVFYPAGKQTVDEITVNYNNMTFTVELSDAVTINNPLYPPYVDFSDIFSSDASFTGTTPGRIYSTDGKTVVLPNVPNTWTYQEGRPLDELVYGDPIEEFVKGYYVSTGWLSADHYKYNKYTQTGVVNSDVYSITKKIQWQIDGKIYNPGDTIELSSGKTATPIITNIGEDYVETKTTTYTRIYYKYVKTGKQYNYTKIDSAPDTNAIFDETITVS